jgi:hypothetical protein
MVPYSVVFNSTCASKISIHSGISPAVGFNALPGSQVKISSYKQEFQKKEREIREKIAARYLKKAVSESIDYMGEQIYSMSST